MLDVVEADNASNAKRKPALEKLKNLQHVTKELRRIPIQEFFIEKGGCEALANWLYPLPDRTFPSVKVVQEIMQVIETLHIDPVFLEKDPKLARVIQVYAKNKAGMHQVLDQAKRIYDKWSRIFFGISTSFYDGNRNDDDEVDGGGHDQYRNLRRQIDTMKQR